MTGADRSAPPTTRRAIAEVAPPSSLRERWGQRQLPGARQVAEFIWVALVIVGLAWVAFVGSTGGVGVHDNTSRGDEAGAGTPRAGADTAPPARSPLVERAEPPGGGASGLAGTASAADSSPTTTSAVAPSTVPVDLAAVAVDVVSSLPADATPVESALRGCRRAGAGVEVEVALAHDAPSPAQMAVLVAVREPDGSVRGRAAAITRSVPPRTAEVIVVPVASAGTEGPAGCTVERLQAIAG